MAGAQNPTEPIGGAYKEGEGTGVCVGPRLLKPGEKKKIAAEKKKKSFAVSVGELGNPCALFGHGGGGWGSPLLKIDKIKSNAGQTLPDKQNKIERHTVFVGPTKDQGFFPHEKQRLSVRDTKD